MRVLVEHLPSAIIAGVVGYIISGDAYCIPLCLFFGWMIDGDHVFDVLWYRWYQGKMPSFFELKTGGYFKANRKVFVPLHAWEWTILLVCAGLLVPAHQIAFIAAAFAHALHLRKDQKIYLVRPLGYSLISRVKQGFSIEGFCQKDAHAY